MEIPATVTTFLRNLVRFDVPDGDVAQSVKEFLASPDAAQRMLEVMARGCEYCEAGHVRWLYQGQYWHHSDPNPKPREGAKVITIPTPRLADPPDRVACKQLTVTA